jgi:hypothetical protein
MLKAIRQHFKRCIFKEVFVTVLALARAALFPIRLSWVRLASLKLFMHASSLILLLPSLALNSRIRDPSTLRLPEALKYGARDSFA